MRPPLGDAAWFAANVDLVIDWVLEGLREQLADPDLSRAERESVPPLVAAKFRAMTGEQLRALVVTQIARARLQHFDDDSTVH